MNHLSDFTVIYQQRGGADKLVSLAYSHRAGPRDQTEISDGLQSFVKLRAFLEEKSCWIPEEGVLLREEDRRDILG